VAKKKLSIPTVTITVRTTPTLRDDLDSVVKSGYFGSTRSEAAERLLGEAVRNLIKEGSLVRKKPVEM
jgi:hypothetical protein